MDNESLVLSFMEISNLPIDEAKSFLEAADYNLELAIQNYYDSRSGLNNGQQSSSTSSQNILENEEEEVRPVIPREYDVMVTQETSRDIQLSMVRQQFNSSFRDLKKEIEIQEELARGQAPKKRCLEDIYRHPVDIAFNLSFHHAKLKGTQLGKWVAVLINNEAFESLSFNRDIFNEQSQKVKNILRKNFIFLRKNCDDIEALRILNLYNLLDCQKIPIFLIIDSVTGELRKNFQDCTKLTLKDIAKELKKYYSKDNQLLYSSSFEDSDDEETASLARNTCTMPSTSHEAQKIINDDKNHQKISNTIKSIESDEESFASLNSNDVSDEDVCEDSQEARVIDSDDETLKKDDGPQTNVLLRLHDESHKFRYPAKRTVANLINYIYRNYLIQTGIYDNKTKRFSLISKIHNKCLTTLDQEKSLEDSDIHPSIVLLHNTIDKE